MWMSRLFGFFLALAGAAWLIFISYALYTGENAGPILLVRVGMPATLLGTLLGAGLVGLGAWLMGFGHAKHGARKGS
jgi:hypothetical protein